jgi:hypothetical protein
MYILVEYRYVSGEYDTWTFLFLPLRKNEKPNVAIHRFFKNMWCDKTITAKKGRLYYGLSHEVAARIEGYREVEDKDLPLLRKYFSGRFM